MGRLVVSPGGPSQKPYLSTFIPSPEPPRHTGRCTRAFHCLQDDEDEDWTLSEFSRVGAPTQNANRRSLRPERRRIPSGATSNEASPREPFIPTVEH